MHGMVQGKIQIRNANFCRYVRSKLQYKSHLCNIKFVDHSDVVGAWRRCSNYIFIIDLTPGFNGLDKDNYKSRQHTFKFRDLVRLMSKFNYPSPYRIDITHNKGLLVLSGGNIQLCQSGMSLQTAINSGNTDVTLAAIFILNLIGFSSLHWPLLLKKLTMT